MNHFFTRIKPSQYATNAIGAHVVKHEEDFPSLENVQIALFGVEEGRFSLRNEGTAKAADEIRKEFYRLAVPTHFPKVADLGNIKQGEDFSDTEQAISDVCLELMKEGIVPILLGGSIEVCQSIYAPLQHFTRNADITVIAPRINLIEQTYLTRIIEHQPDFLFNLSVLGYQGHYCSKEHIDTLQKMHFAPERLGYLKNHLAEAEPVLRNADVVVLDVGAVKQADAPANYNSNPSGFSSEEICQLAWYAGVSDKVRAIALFEMNPEFDYRNQTAKLLSQYIWYFVDGFIHRKNDHPDEHEDFVMYRCTLQGEPDVLFKKSKRTDRWWMQIKNKSGETLWVPCSYSDYQTATSGDTPDRFWRAIQKVH
jgi:arginase family enzyme